MSPSARPVERHRAGDLVPVALTVNGSRVELEVPARATLSDVLRDRLGLTGTHVGCEHGVCGMCTIHVDGDAARACLLFAVQVDGSEIVTVEGLADGAELHPLQEAFGRHHALQCGFCTPGFLMSSLDLLGERPDVTEEELPEELSGVICRCTGYPRSWPPWPRWPGTIRRGRPQPWVVLRDGPSSGEAAQPPPPAGPKTVRPRRRTPPRVASTRTASTFPPVSPPCASTYGVTSTRHPSRSPHCSPMCR